MGRAKQPVTIDDVQFDALIDDSESLQADIPEYPTEDGYAISDNICMKSEQLAMTLYITETPVTWSGAHGGQGWIESVVSKLKKLYFDRKIVTVTTYDRVWQNMGIEKIDIARTSEPGYAKEVKIGLKKVYITATKTASIPASYGKSGATEAANGVAKTGDQSKNGNTILYNVGVKVNALEKSNQRQAEKYSGKAR